MGTPNKDAEGNFTDEAIKAIEDETERLAEIVGMDPMELGELFADATHLISIDTVEEELISMKMVAVECLNDGFEKLSKSFKRKHAAFKWLSATSFICGGIAILMGIFGVVGDNTPMIILTAIFGFLMVLTMLPCMILTNAQEYMLGAMKSRNDKAYQLATECSELVKLLQ